MVRGINRSQLDWIQAAPIVGLNLTVSGASTNVSTTLATLLNTAGRGGVAVPTQVSTGDTLPGLICTGVNNRVRVRRNGTEDPIRSGEEEVYARLTNAGAVYTFTYYTNTNGTETAYTFAAATPIDFIVNYRFEAEHIPTDALVSAQTLLLNPDNTGNPSGTYYAEPLTIATLNTVPNLTKTPTSTSVVQLIVNAASYFATTTSPAFSISGKAITWIPANGFPLEVGADVVATYTTNE